MKVTVEKESYATIAWYGINIEIDDKDYEANVQVSFDENSDSAEFEINYSDELPDGTDEEEVERLIIESFEDEK